MSGHLKSVEAVGGSITPLYTFQTNNLSGDNGWQRRTETIEIGAVDYGYSPFGSGAAPLATKSLSWPVMVLTHGDPDGAKDAIAAACGNGRPVWLVWKHSGGYERVATAELERVRWPHTGEADFKVDATLDFVIREAWHERFYARQQVVGAGNAIVVGPTPPGTNTTLADPSIALPSTAPTFLPDSTADATVVGPGGVPTLADTTLRVILYGPYGGDPVQDAATGAWIDGGFSLVNTSVPIRDTAGGPTNPQLTVRVKLAAGEFMVIDCGAKTIVASGIGNAEQRRVRYRYQPYWFTIEPNSLNKLLIAPAGANPVAGGRIDIQWQRRYL